MIWYLSNFNYKFQMVPESHSILAGIGSALALLFLPLGFNNWRAVVAVITGLVAKENVVGTFGVLFSKSHHLAENGRQIWPLMRQAFTPAAGYAFLIFNLLCAPCFAAMGAIRREMGNAKWTFMAIGYQCTLAYVMSLIVYQLSHWLLEGGPFTIGTMIGLAACFVCSYGLFFYKPKASSTAQFLKTVPSES